MAVFDLFLGRVSGDKRVDVVGQAITVSVGGVNVIATAAGDWLAVGSSVVSVFAAQTWTPAEPSGIAFGDLMVACIATRYANSTFTITPPSGWTMVSQAATSDTTIGSSGIGSAYMAYIVRGTTTPAMTFTFGAGSNAISLAQVWFYRGGKPTSTVDVSIASTTAVATTAISVTGLTTTVANDLIVAVIGGGTSSDFTSFNATTPSGASGAIDTITPPQSSTWTKRQGDLTILGAQTALAVFDAVKATAGATGNFTATASLGAGHAVAAGAFRINVVTSISTVVSGQALAASVGSATVATGVGINVSAGTLALTASVDTVTVSTVQNMAHLVSGIVMTSAVGSVVVSTPSGVDVTTNLMTSAVGTVTVDSVSNLGVAVSTNLMVSAVGAATVAFGSSANVTTNVMAVAVGGVSVTAGGTVSIFVAGNSLTVGVGDIAVAAVTTAPVTGLGLAASVGAVSVSVGMRVSLNGLQISTAVQNVSLRFASNLPVDGLLMNARAGNIYSTNWGTSDSVNEVWTTVPHH